MSHISRRLLATSVAIVLLLSGQVALATTASAQLWKVPAPDLSLDPLSDLTEYENRVVHLVNKKRKAADLKPVRYFNKCVDRAAERWSAHLVELGELKHRNLTKLLKSCDLDWVGEALVRGAALSPAGAVNAWMNSPPHRAILMKPRAKHAGVGTKVDDEGRLVSVLNFSDPD